MGAGRPSVALATGRSVALTRAESDLRRLARGRCLPAGLPSLLARHLPPGFAYLNVGHSNLTDRVLGGVKKAQGRIAVLIHDVIPLDHPAYQRPGTVAPFRAKIDRVSAQADLVIYNSQDTRQRSEAQIRGRIPLPLSRIWVSTCPRPMAVNCLRACRQSFPFCRCRHH